MIILKCITFLFLLNMLWYSRMFTPVLYLNQFLGVILLIVLFIVKYHNKSSFHIQTWLMIYFVFVIYSLFTGFFVTENFSLMINGLITFIQFILLIFIINEISIDDNNLLFITKSLFIIGIIYSLSMYFFGIEAGGERLKISIYSNSNGDALVLFLSIFSGLWLWIKQPRPVQVLIAVTIFFQIYLIFLTGSRKALLSVFVVIFLPFLSQINFKYVIKYIIYGFIIVLIGYWTIFFLSIDDLIISSPTYIRLIDRGILITDDIARVSMYKEAFELFTQKPLFGWGLDNFRIISTFGTYSHSTYAELLVSSGSIGFIIYLSLYFHIFINLIQIYMTNRIDVNTKLIIILFIIFLILGSTVIHFYSIRDTLILSIFISYISFKNKKAIVLLKIG